MCEVIVVTSGKGGVGKTTTSANIGTGLASLGNRVVMIDTDIGLRNLDVVLGLENRIVYNLIDVIEGNCRYKQALIKARNYNNLYLLPCAQTRDKTAVSPEQIIKLIDEIRDEYDYIIIDCPAGIEQGFKNAIAAADRAVIVTTPEVSAIRDADRIIGLLEAYGIEKQHLIINRIRYDMVKKGNMMSVDDVVDILAVDLLGVIADDEDIVISTNKGEPVVCSNTKSGHAYMNICRKIVDDSLEVEDYYSGKNRSLRSLFRRKEPEGRNMGMNKIYLYNTGSYAKERLISMLASDRIGCNPDFLDDMKHTIKQEIDRYINVKESDIDIQVKERMLVAYIPLLSVDTEKKDNEYTYRTTGRGSVNYELIQEGSTELKTIQS